MKGKTLSSLALALLIALSAMAVLPVQGQPETTATMYFEPSTFNGNLDIGNKFWTSVMIKDFTNLYGWQVEITWHAETLRIVDVLDPTELIDDIFDILKPVGAGTMWNDGMVDNVHGIYTYCGYNLKAVTVGVDGVPGVGYKMMEIQFEVIGYGSSPIHYNQPWPEYPAPTDHTYWINPTLAEQPCIYTDGLATTKAPPAPYGPTAAFIWFPTIPKIDEIVTFDASGSKAGFNGIAMCPIEEYRWDFNGDGVFEHNVTTAGTTHVFTEPLFYLVTLEVYAPGTTVEETDSITKTVQVIPPPMGAAIDIYCQKVPFDGTGPNVQCDSFAPQELMIIYAKVTYNDDPVEGKLVGFEVRDSNDECVLYRTAQTNAAGVAVIEFRVPSMPAFGDWIAIGIVDVAGTTVADTMPFRVGWIVEIVSVTPDNTVYYKGQDMWFEIEIINIALTTKTVTLTFVVYDTCSVPIGQFVVADWSIDADVTAPYATTVAIPVPTWAFVGTATVYVNSFTDLPIDNGVPTCPEISADFLISKP